MGVGVSRGRDIVGRGREGETGPLKWLRKSFPSELRFSHFLSPLAVVFPSFTFAQRRVLISFPPAVAKEGVCDMLQRDSVTS